MMRTSILITVLWWMPQIACAQTVDYLREVKPILTAHCFTCHGAIKQKAGLRLDTVAHMKEGGDRGSALDTKNFDQSLLLKHVLGEKGFKRMPPEHEGEALKLGQIAVLRRWIEQGAAGPKDEKPEADPRDHWAFRAPVRPVIPKVKNAAWVRNPVDAFIAAEHERHGLTPQSPAERGVLLRRVYLDLIGLPPTREEMQSFLADQSPDAYEKVVDRLLASPQHGERWGRHWMDIWRYSDWWGLGAELRNSQRHIWHWRDWIVDSLNKDKGYDRMLLEMLAADELYPTNTDALRGTGFLARHYFLFNRTTWLDETVEHTSKAFLGLTFNCCKCHDHKYDAFTQVDYYRFRAIFEPYQIRLDNVPGELDVAKNGMPRVYDAHLDMPTYLHVRGNESNADKNRKIMPGLPRLLLPDGLPIKPIKLPAEAYQPGLRAFVLLDHVRLAEKQRVGGQAEAAAAHLRLASAEKLPKESAPPPKAKETPEQIRAAIRIAEQKIAHAEATITALNARSAADWATVKEPAPDATKKLARAAASAEKRQTYELAKWNLARAEGGDASLKMTLAQARAAVDAARKALENPGEIYTPLVGALKTLESNLETDANRRKPFPKESTGRRAALAQWVAARENPLTARVAVNHLWTRHFGQPLVATVFDFGRKGAAPTHPALLDWLAVEMMDPVLPFPSGRGAGGEGAWSMKHVHRLLVTSNAYRMASSSLGAAEKNRRDDAENRLYWRMNSQRMESQVVRDSLLHLAGELDLARGGPSIETPQQDASKRRSLYFFHSAIERNKFLSTFDEADPLDCYRRRDSIIPQQALALSNSKLAGTMAEKIAARLEKAVAPKDFASEAFAWMLGYAPTVDETAACEQAMQRWVELNKMRPDAERRARAQLIQALLNHNDFITIR
jgi:hypothetical protein